MALLLDLCVMLISVVFLSIVGFVAGVAIPGLFMPAAAPPPSRCRLYRRR